MSRALDADIISLLKSGNHQQVYDDISGILYRLPQNKEDLLEIEILGRSHPLESGVAFLRDHLAIAIPKLRLVQAFFIARDIFQKHLTGGGHIDHDELRKATSVILLMDPEHLTAANTRKRIISTALKGAHANTEAVLSEERQFIDSLLTSRLHRHTKSPTLWSHRRWLLEVSRTYCLNINLSSMMQRVVMVSAERHPRNYYAWCHARWLVDNLCDIDTPTEVVELTRKWCLAHHTDISGWLFLLFLCHQTSPASCPDIFDETIEIAQSLRWTNESVWVFLRTLAATEYVRADAAEKLAQTVGALAASSPEESPGSRIMRNAPEWVHENTLSVSQRADVSSMSHSGNPSAIIYHVAAKTLSPHDLQEIGGSA